MTANETIADRTIRHQLYLTRLQTQEANQIVEFLDNDVIPDLEAQLARRLRNIRDRGFDTGPQTTQRVQGLIDSLNEIVAGGVEVARSRMAESMEQIARQESQWQVGAIKEALPVTVNMNPPSVRKLRQAVIERPFDGMPLAGWFEGLGQQSQRNIERAIRQGIVEGETAGQIQQRVIGRRGPVDMTRANAFAIAKTATLHASTQARRETFRDNDDIVKRERWLATLDARTCVECQSLDGRVFDLDKGQRPPAHVGCRCTVTAVLKSWREMGIDLDEAPAGTRASMDGQVPAKLNYPQWLRQQVQAGRMDVVNEALGPSRAKLFAAGGIEVRQFTDRAGRRLTLAELRRREQEVFDRLDVNAP